MKKLIHQLEQYLRETLGTPVAPHPWEKSSRLPQYLRERYRFFKMDVLGTECVLGAALGGLSGKGRLSSYGKGSGASPCGYIPCLKPGTTDNGSSGAKSNLRPYSTSFCCGWRIAGRFFSTMDKSESSRPSHDWRFAGAGWGTSELQYSGDPRTSKSNAKHNTILTWGDVCRFHERRPRQDNPGVSNRKEIEHTIGKEK